LTLITIIAGSYYGYAYHYDNFFNTDAEPPLIELSESNPSGTIFTPVLDAKIDKNKNLIYCSTFQLAWNQLAHDVIKDTVEIKEAPDYVSKLNSMINLPPCVSEDAYIAIAGLIKDNVINKTKKLLSEKFGENLFDLIGRQNFDSKDIIAFSYLFKNLPFEKIFEKINGHIMEFDGKKSVVKAFGIEKDKQLEKLVNVVCFNYKNNDQFIITLKTKSNTDEVVISTIPPEETLEKTYIKIRNYFGYFEKNVDSADHFTCRTAGRGLFLAIPKIDFNIRYHFDKMNNKKILNKNFEKYFITASMQGIRFKMNEKGVVLKSYSFLDCTMGEHLTLIVKGPFLVYLKDKNHNKPYFMAYIGNDELLVKN